MKGLKAFVYYHGECDEHEEHVVLADSRGEADKMLQQEEKFINIGHFSVEEKPIQKGVIL